MLMESKCVCVCVYMYVCVHAHTPPYACGCAKLLHSCPTLCNPIDYIAYQAPLSMGFSRLENGYHVLLQGIFPTQGSNLHLLMSLALAGGFFATMATWEAPSHAYVTLNARVKLRYKKVNLHLFHEG